MPIVPWLPDTPLMPSEAAQQAERQQLASRLGITPRQLQLLTLLSEGLTNKAIGLQLYVSDNTVKSHLKALYAALDCHNRTACVNIARQLGLLSH